MSEIIQTLPMVAESHGVFGLRRALGVRPQGRERSRASVSSPCQGARAVKGRATRRSRSTERGSRGTSGGGRAWPQDQSERWRGGGGGS